jgi:hypothetical protein
MKITIYKSKTNPDLGFSIQEDFGNKYDPQTKQLKRTKDKIFTLWIDEFEGGEAYETDWTYVSEFKSHGEALQYVIDNYGEVEKIAVY